MSKVKVLIELDEDIMSAIKDYNVSPSQVDTICEQILNGTPLNGTNGEVFEKIMSYMFMDDAYITTDRRGYLHLRGVKDDWWSAEYKGAENDRNNS